MKRIGFLLVSLLCCIASIAQTSTGHLTFKGIPIDGTLKEFVSKLEKTGLSYFGEYNGSAILEGEFAGCKECQIWVNTIEGSDVVRSVAVCFPATDEWSMLESNYRMIKNVLTKKYGAPCECTEEFQGYGYPRDNSDKLLRLKMDKCTYKTIYYNSNGVITLSLAHTILRTFVVLFYVNNDTTIGERLMEDL